MQERPRPGRRLGADQRARRPDRSPRHLRLQRPLRLPHRLPDQRRHRHARQRDAPPAGPGHHAADRQGLPQPAEDQPRRPRPVRRRLAGDGRFLPDQQPDHARPERRRAHQEGRRRRARAHRLRAPGPRLPHPRKPGERCTTASAGPTASSAPRRRSAPKRRCTCSRACGWASTWA